MATGSGRRVAGVLGAIVAVLSGLGAASGLQAQTPVSVELVLAVDTSLSVDDREFALQMTGIAEAFRTPDILELIRQQKGVAVALFQWSGEPSRSHLIPWHLLTDAASVLAFAAKVETAEREPQRQFTGIGKAIAYAVSLLTDNAFAGRALKIDVSGDGRDNIGSLPSKARPVAAALGIEINGLPILVDTYNLDTYYREKVILGPGAFVEIAKDYDDFARAFRRKLRREIAPQLAGPFPGPAGSLVGLAERRCCIAKASQGGTIAAIDVTAKLHASVGIDPSRPVDHKNRDWLTEPDLPVSSAFDRGVNR